MSVGRSGQSDVAVAARFGGLDAPLDLADGIEIFVELGAVAAAQRRREPRGLRTDGIQDAAARACAREPLGARAAVAE